MTKFVALYRLFLRTQLTTARLLLVAGFTMFCVTISLAVSSSVEPFELQEAMIEGLGSHLGLGMGVPILALVFSTSTLSELVEDETLVYFWHRPASRWYIAVSAWAASVTATVPAVAAPLFVGGLIGSKGSVSTAAAIAVSSGLASAAYCALFVLLGVLLRRSLIWGLLYVFIWEATLTRLFPGLDQSSVRYYAEAVAGHIDDYAPFVNARSLPTMVLSLVFITVSAVGLTTWRLNTMDVA